MSHLQLIIYFIMIQLNRNHRLNHNEFSS